MRRQKEIDAQRKRYRACDRKKHYIDKLHALSMVSKLKEEQGLTQELHPYRCFYCNRWHLTKNKPKEKLDITLTL